MLYTPLAFYLFISFSMPQHLIANYMQEASHLSIPMTLVLKGVSNNEKVSLKQALISQLLPLLNKQKTPIKIIIHPGLFDEFNIQAVPAFVITYKNANYCKLSGAVTAAWALYQLQKNTPAHNT